MGGAVKTLTLELTGRNTGLGRMFNDSGQQIAAFQKKVEGSNRTLSLSQAAIKGAVAGATALAAGLSYAITKAVAFDKAMRNVNSLSKLNETQFASMEKQVISMSTKLPQSATTLAEGLYDIASSGFQGADGLTVLDAAARSASAGLTSTATSSKAITAVLNAYGLKAKDAADVSDVLFSTVNLGVISFDELANNLGDVVGATAAAKVGIDEVGAAIATMTLSGIKGAQATTALSSLTTKLVQPSAALAELYDELGYKSGAAALEGKGLHGVMEDIRVATGGNITTMLQLFPDIEAARGALALMANDGANYTKVADQITDKTKRMGATQEVLDEQMKGVSAQWQLFTNQIDAAAIGIGVKLLPQVTGAMKGAQNLGAAIAKTAIQIKQDGAKGLEDFGDAAHNVVDFLQELGEAALSGGAAIAQAVGPEILDTFTTLAGLLKDITGLALDNQGAVIALGLAYAVHMAGGVGALNAGLDIMSAGLSKSYDFIAGLMTPGVEGVADSWTKMGDRAKAAGSKVKAAVIEFAPAAGIGGVLALGVVAWQGYSKAAQRAGEITKSTGKAMSSIKVDDLQAELKKAQDYINDYQTRLDDIGHSDSLAGALGDFFNVGKNFETVGMQDNLEKVQDAANQTAQRIGLLQYNTLELYKLMGQPIPDEAKWINDVQGANGAVAQATAMSQMNTVLDQLGPKLKAAGVDMGALWNDQQMTNAAGAIFSLKDGTDQAAAAQDNFIAAMGGAEKALGDTKSAADTLKNALDVLMGTELNVDKANIAWLDGLGALKKELKENGATLSMNTQKGRDNRSAIIDQVEVLQDQLVANANAGASQEELTAKLSGGRDALIAAGVAAHIPKEAMVALLAQYKLTPEMVKTLIAESGAASTKDKLKDLQEQADALNKKKPKPKVSADTANAQNKLANVQHQLDAIDGRNARASVSLTQNTYKNLVETHTVAPVGVLAPNRGAGANGGIYGQNFVKSFADGKLPKEALIQQAVPGGIFQWAEDETEGEAFIPMAKAKRGRSTAILKKVASEFGLSLVQTMADGGITSYANGGINAAEVFSGLQSAAETKARAYAEHRANRSKSTKDTADDWYKKPILSIQQYITALKSAETAQRQWSTTTRNLAAKVGSDVVESLQGMGEDGEAAIKKMATSSVKDMTKMAESIRRLNFSSFVSDTAADIKGKSAFQANLQALVKMGRGDLAGRFSEMGYDSAAGLAAQAVKSPGSTLTQLNNMLSQQESLNDPKSQEAFKLVQLIQRSVGKLGIMGLAQASGMPVGDVMGLLSSYEGSLFGKIPASAMKQIRADQALLRAGKQPSGLAMGAIVRGSQTGYYWGEPSSGGESLIPHGLDRRQRALELYRQTGRILGAGSSGGASYVTISPGAVTVNIPVTQPGASMAQIQAVAQQAVGSAMNGLVRELTTGRRS